MTLGEKISAGRKSAGLTQEQLAQQLCVSRAAVAKWETDAGMPDILNLRALAALFAVSMEDLLDESRELENFRFREEIDLRDYKPAGRCRSSYDAAVAARFPEAYWIRRVVLQHGLTLGQRVLDFLTFGMVEFCWALFHIKEYGGMHYLVELGDRQYFVTVEKTAITTAPMPYHVRAGEFWLGEKKYLVASRDLLKQAG